MLEAGSVDDRQGAVGARGHASIQGDGNVQLIVVALRIGMDHMDRAVDERALTIWLTGLSGAGKTTIGHALAEEIRQLGRKVELLDGDVVRANLSKGLGFTKEDRDTNIRRIGFVSHLLTRNGVTVIVAAISPYKDVRAEVRREIGAFLEVYVKCPLEELVRRDVKGLYQKALRGEIAHFTGVSDPYEEPDAPEVVVETDRETVEQSVGKVLAALEAFGYVGQGTLLVAGTLENSRL